METYNNYDYGTGGLFFSNMSSGLSLGGLGGIGNLDRLTSGQTRTYETRAYDIFNSFNLPKPAPASEDIFLSDDEENGPKPRLPLFSRCPVTNRATLEPPAVMTANRNNLEPSSGMTGSNSTGGKMKSLSLSPLKNLTIGTSPIKSRGSPLKSRQYDIMGHSPRIPLLSLANQANRISNYQEPAKISYSQVASKPAEPSSPERGGDTSPLSFNNLQKAAKQPSSAVKLSLDDVKDDSLVAMTNKHGKGKYWFKSGCPTPDPRWSSCQQLMIGPIPGDVEYSTLRSAFLSKGHTIHLFIQNNQAWLEKNQEKFGKKQVKFGYVVYTDSMVAQRLLSAGHVMVGHAKVAVKEMDGQPAQFVN